MYEERRNRLSLRDIILIILLMVLFIFVMVWLFPTKGYLEQNNVIVDNEIYNNYLENMSTVAKDYFINSKMPSNVGDTVKLTLSDMLEKKLIVEIGGNTSCDLEKSFIEVTKMDEDFQLRVELSCTDYYDYKLITLGCKDYCNLDCGKEDTTTVITPIQQSTKKYTVTFDSQGGSSVASQKVVSGKTATKPANPTKEGYTFVEWTLNGKTYNFATPVKSNITLVASWKTNVVVEEPVITTDYLYTKTTSAETIYSNWSNWSSTKRQWDEFNLTNTDLVEYKIVAQDKEQVDTEKNCTTTKEVKTVVDTKNAITSTKKVYKNAIVKTETVYTDWVKDKLYTTSTTPLRNKDTDTVKYVFLKVQTRSVCTGCEDITEYYYEKYTRTASEKTTYSCNTTYKSGSGKNLVCWNEVKGAPTCASYGSEYELVNGKCVKYNIEKAKTTCENKPIYRSYTDYQVRTRTITSTTTSSYDEKYSTSNNDTNLISQGYKLTKTCTTQNGNRTCK